MSAVVCAFSYGGDPIDPQIPVRMHARLSHRGPDGGRVWQDGNVALGAQQFWTTPEAVGEVLPLVTDRYVVTSTARLDNRDELCRVLGLPTDVPESRIILAAYERWGDSCLEYFLGVFAFAVWDRSEGRLFFARDHFGVRPVYYTHIPEKRLLLIATEIKALFEHPAVEQRINEIRLFEYLSGNTKRDREITIYHNIKRLEPGHVITADRGGPQIRKYWSLEPQEIRRYDNEQRYVDEFREVFEESIRCRMRTNLRAGSELSGGLDSSYVTAVARDLSNGEEWHAISNVFDHFPECDEREYMDHVLAQGGVTSYRVVSDEIGPLSMLPEIFRAVDDPYTGGNHHMVWQCYQTARENDVRVLLDGYDGDTTIGHGVEVFRRWGRRNEWAKYWQEAEMAAAHLVDAPHRQTLQVEMSNPRMMLQHDVDVVLREHLAGLRYDRFAKTISAVARDLNLDRRKLYRKYLRTMLIAPIRRDGLKVVHARDEVKVPDFLNPDFVSRPEIQERIQLHESPEDFGDYERSLQLGVLRSDIFSRSLEIMDHYGSAWGIDVRHPFMDKRLVEYCLSLPLEQSFQQGWSRWVMRQAMEGVVPEEVRWRSGKANLARAFDHGFFVIDHEHLERAIELGDAVGEYVRPGYLRDLYDRRDDLEGREIWQLAFLASLSLWFGR